MDLCNILASMHGEVVVDALNLEGPVAHALYRQLSVCGDSHQGASVVAECTQLVARANEHIQARPYNEVTLRHLVLHQLASIFLAIALVNDSLNLAEALRVLDESLIVSGFPVQTDACVSAIYATHAALAPVPALPDGLDEQRLTQIPLSLPQHRFPAIRELYGGIDALTPEMCRDLADTPFIVRGGCADWPAVQKWTLRYLLATAGRRLVPIEIGSTYLQDDWSQSLMPMHEFIHQYVVPQSLQQKSDAKAGYLAQHDLFRQLPHLRADVMIPDAAYYFPPVGDDDQDDGQIRLNAWFGPAGTVTPAHHDGPLRNLFAQVVGSKRAVLFPPTDGGLLADQGDDSVLSNSSGVNVRDWSSALALRPELAGTHGCEVVCQPGDLLYIPPLWWHYLESLSLSFSVSMWWS